MDDDQQQGNVGGQGNPPMNGGTPAGNGTGDPQQSQTKGDGDSKKTPEQELEEFLKATPPPEPRGSAYKHTSAFVNFTTTVKIPPHPNTSFDEKYFLFLFSGSLSLSLEEKRDIIAKIPNLSQFQIDELIKILEEEKQKFDELEKKHPEQVQKLKLTATKEWEVLEMDDQKSHADEASQQQADDIRKQLGLDNDTPNAA